MRGREKEKDKKKYIEGKTYCLGYCKRIAGFQSAKEQKTKLERWRRDDEV